MEVYTNQTGKVVVNSLGKIHTNEPQTIGIVTDGLVMWLDGADAPSGGYWVDKKGTYNCTIEGNVTHSSNDGGKYIIGTSGSDRLYNSSIDMTSGAFTIMTAGRYLQSSGQGRLYSNVGGSVNWALGWGGSSEYYYSNGWVIGNNVFPTDWKIFATSNNSSKNNGLLYWNNIQQTINFNTFSAPLGISFGNESSGGNFSEHSNSEFGFYLCYNRQLTTEEMTQNYNYYKNRYGL